MLLGFEYTYVFCGVVEQHPGYVAVSLGLLRLKITVELASSESVQASVVFFPPVLFFKVKIQQVSHSMR